MNTGEGNVRLFKEFSSGRMYCGDSREYMQSVAEQDSVDLIVTSPPYPLNSPKPYGNPDAASYVDWFDTFVPGFLRVLRESGSLVINLGSVWDRGQPTRSLYQYDLLLRLVREHGLYFCQDLYWFKPTVMPCGPAIFERNRVKDAVETLLWFSKSARPKADNKRVLAPYSERMRKHIRDGISPKTRPSGHTVREDLAKDNGGAIPPNVLCASNGESNGAYMQQCRANNIPIHPARFPEAIPEFLIRFLTEPGDLVFDPFAGSCTTGAVADRIGRRWVCCEANEEYLRGAEFRFIYNQRPKQTKPKFYQIPAPCGLPENVGPLLPTDAPSLNRLDSDPDMFDQQVEEAHL